jgi:hypothetical protein
MPELSERRRKPRRRTIRFTGAVWLTLEDVTGAAGDVNAKLVDTSDDGIGVETQVAVKEQTIFVVKGNDESIPNGAMRARVIRVSTRADGSYRVGLTFEQAKDVADVPVAEVDDYYEVLQVNAKADPDTIHRVYRLLAQRFHPDNAETGNSEVFRAILKAYKILGDPEKRAAYDVQLQAYRQFRGRIFDPALAVAGKQTEKHKRRAVLELLYTARLNNSATMTIHEFEDLLGCPREHLEFTLWYLKENAMIVRSDNGRYSITARGVDQAESQESVATPKARLLSAGL